MKTLFISISLLFLIDSNVMHEDTPLQIDKKGNIIGLPEQFLPATFDLSQKKLRIHDKEIIFPKCLSYYFQEHKSPVLNLSASWYHSKDDMPYYLDFDISDNSANYGYTILVDLETLELIYVRKSIQEGTTIHSPKVDLEEKCLKEYRNRIKSLN
jgi:hypothetical protein